MSERIKAQCLQQKTGSCYGCPVMSEVYDKAVVAASGGSSYIVEKVIDKTVKKAASEQCPEGVSPQKDLINIELRGEGVWVYPHLPNNGRS